MANLLWDLVYISLADARESSSVLCNWEKPNDKQLTQIITEAQYLIDTFIWSYWEKQDPDQMYIFPTVWDGIPNDIKVATVRTSEQLYLMGKSLWSIRWDRITSESNMSRTVVYSDKESFNSYVESVWIPKKVLNILNKYKNNFIWQVL
jgi:hypothetical protein